MSNKSTEESSFGIFSVTAETAEQFSDILPEDMMSRIELPGYYVLGAFGSNDEILGVLVLYIGAYTDRSIYSKICYIFVDEDYRRMGVGTALMEEYHSIVREVDIRESFVEIDKASDDIKAFETFFDNMCYDFTGGVVEKEYIITTDDITGKDPYGEVETKNIKPIKKLSDEDFLKLMNRIIKSNKNETVRRATDVELEVDRKLYDPWLSVYYSNKRGEGLFLVRELKENVYESAFLYSYGQSDEDGLRMMLFSSAKLMRKISEDRSVLYIGEADGVTSETIQMICPKLVPSVMEKGVRVFPKNTRTIKKEA